MDPVSGWPEGCRLRQHRRTSHRVRRTRLRHLLPRHDQGKSRKRWIREGSFVLSLSSVRRDSQSNNDTLFRARASFIPALYKHAQMHAHWPAPGEELVRDRSGLLGTPKLEAASKIAIAVVSIHSFYWIDYLRSWELKKFGFSQNQGSHKSSPPGDFAALA